MTPREKVQVTLIFAAIFCTIFGSVLLFSFEKKNKDVRPIGLRTGFWKDGGVSSESAREFAPWVIAVGVVASVGAFVVREK